MPSNSGSGEWQHMVAGGVAGSVAVLFLHPFDVIKTRLQVQDGAGPILQQYRGPIHAVRKIAAQEGWRAFYKGLTPAIIGSGVSWGAYLYVYEVIKAWHSGWQGTGERLSPGWNLLSAAQAGATVCLFTNPIWLVKTRLQLQRLPALQAGAAAAAAAGTSPPVIYRGFVDALAKIMQHEGIKGLYKGLGPSLLLQSTHGAVQFAVYEELKYFASRISRSPAAAGSSGKGPAEKSTDKGRTLGSAELSLFAAASKLSASIFTYPTQVVRSRLQQRMDDGRSLVYRSATEAAHLTWQREGIRGFYKGLAPALVRVMPQSALTLVVYENVLRLLQEHSARAAL